jgi:aquaporin Z
MLTLVVVGGAVIDIVTHGARSVAPGLVVMALIYAVGEVSGAHCNPAVTFGFALHRAFAWRMVPVHWLA